MHSAQHQQSGRISRRQFLRALGIGAVALGTSRVLPGHAQQRFVVPEDTFGRMFPRLPSFFAHVRERELLISGVPCGRLANSGGIMDAKDNRSG